MVEGFELAVSAWLQPLRAAAVVFHSGLRESRTKAFALQLIWALGARLDKLMAKLSEASPNELVAAGVDVLESTLSMRRKVALYVQACRQVADRSNCRFMSGSADKSSVASYSLLSAYYSVPGNTAWWGVPQDASQNSSVTCFWVGEAPFA